MFNVTYMFYYTNSFDKKNLGNGVREFWKWEFMKKEAA